MVFYGSRKVACVRECSLVPGSMRRSALRRRTRHPLAVAGSARAGLDARPNQRRDSQPDAARIPSWPGARGIRPEAARSRRSAAAWVASHGGRQPSRPVGPSPDREVRQPPPGPPAGNAGQRASRRRNGIAVLEVSPGDRSHVGGASDRWRQQRPVGAPVPGDVSGSGRRPQHPAAVRRRSLKWTGGAVASGPGRGTSGSAAPRTVAPAAAGGWPRSEGRVRRGRCRPDAGRRTGRRPRSRASRRRPGGRRDGARRPPAGGCPPT